MIAEIRRLLLEVPFRPFAIVTSSGKQYFVASSDHASFSPSGARVLVWFDDDTNVDISGLHVVAIERGMSPAGQNA